MSHVIEVQHLFRPLDEALIALLRSLESEEWERPTVAGSWRVKDVAAHLLDGNIRALSMQRDRYFGEQPPDIEGYTDLVNWLNTLNHQWVSAMNRLSSNVLILLHEATGPATCGYYESLNLMGEAIFAVDWAGEHRSLNWMHLAREYTEKWHHQQQIRHATGKEGIMTTTYFAPLMETYIRALPHTFREVEAAVGTIVEVRVIDAGRWFLQKSEDHWELISNPDVASSAAVQLEGTVAWQLFSKNIRPNNISEGISLTGDERLGKQVLQMVAVMA